MFDEARFYEIFGALMVLTLTAMLLERALAWLFDHRWYIELTTNVIDLGDDGKKGRQAKIPGLNAFIGLGFSVIICVKYKFDVPASLFPDTGSHPLGLFLTSLVLAGGSAGAMSLFQGFLGMSREARVARVAEAESRKKIAVAQEKEAEAKRKLAEAMLEAATES